MAKRYSPAGFDALGENNSLTETSSSVGGRNGRKELEGRTRFWNWAFTEGEEASGNRCVLGLA